MGHEILGFQQLPELLQYRGGSLRRDAAQFSQFLGEALHVCLWQRAQNLLGRLLAHGHQQNRRLAHATHVRRPLTPYCSALAFLLGQYPASFPFTICSALFKPCSALVGALLVGVNPALQQPGTLRRLAF